MLDYLSFTHVLANSIKNVMEQGTFFHFFRRIKEHFLKVDKDSE